MYINTPCTQSCIINNIKLILIDRLKMYVKINIFLFKYTNTEYINICIHMYIFLGMIYDKWNEWNKKKKIFFLFFQRIKNFDNKIKLQMLQLFFQQDWLRLINNEKRKKI